MRQDDGFSLKVTEASFIKGVSGSTIRLMSKILGLYADILNPQTKKNNKNENKTKPISFYCLEVIFKRIYWWNLCITIPRNGFVVKGRFPPSHLKAISLVSVLQPGFFFRYIVFHQSNSFNSDH